MELTSNKVYVPLFDNKDRYLVLKGSAGSGKSVFASQKIIVRLITETKANHKFICARKVRATVKQSVYAELRKRISELGIAHEFTFNLTELTITHVPTGNLILCIGLDDEEKLKSIEGVTGIWVEEATEFTDLEFSQLDTRLRGYTKQYKQIILSFNPVSHMHWIKKYFFDTEWPKVVKDEETGEKVTVNCTKLQTTFRDNKFLTTEDKAVLRAKAEISPNFYRVYYLGEWGVAEVENPFMWAFSDTNIKPVALIPNQIIYVSFDFNVDPMTASVHQFGHDFYHTIDEFRINNANTNELCERIKSKYGHMPMRVTGDASGKNRSATSHYNNFEIINQVLRPMKIDVLKRNPPIEESRVLSNSILMYHPNRFIDPKCEHLIEDCRLVKMKNGGIDKTSDARLTHLLDTLRYMDATYHNKFVSHHLKRIKESVT